MGLEIRSIKQDELDEFNRLGNLSFAAPPQFRVNMAPEWTFCGFVDGKMATTYAVLPLTMQFNGKSMPLAGITSVTTLPIYRRKGILRKITETHFKMLYEAGEKPISALFASMATLYQRYGYAIVSSKNAYTVEPRSLKFALKQPVHGEFREAGDKDMNLMLNLYHTFIEKRNGYLRRNEGMELAPGAPFTIFNFPLPSPVPPVKFIYQENEEPLGYIIYSVEMDMAPGRPMGQRLAIRDIVWLSASAYRAIWEHLSNMDLVREISWIRVPTDDPLSHMLLEPRMLNSISSDGLLARIIDVEKALPKRLYPEEGKLTFEIIDEVCQWNNGKWKMETSGAEAVVSRTNEKVQLAMPVSTLAMLAFGQISATEAARMARLDVHDHKALPEWDRIMKTGYRPFCADMF